MMWDGLAAAVVGPVVTGILLLVAYVWQPVIKLWLRKRYANRWYESRAVGRPSDRDELLWKVWSMRAQDGKDTLGGNDPFHWHPDINRDPPDPDDMDPCPEKCLECGRISHARVGRVRGLVAEARRGEECRGCGQGRRPIRLP